MNQSPLNRLLSIMKSLRDPVTGCPWDKEQDFASIAPYTIEEAYEVEDAISRANMHDLKEELGDLLFQVVFHARIAEELGLFNFDDVAESIGSKLIRRHPHVFAGTENRTSDEQTVAWEIQKAEERKAKSLTGLLDDIPVGLPGLSRALKLTKRAARVGFDWPDINAVVDKLDEEVAELKIELASNNTQKSGDELGDVLFVLANLARKLDLEPEECIRRTNTKFTNRFAYIENALKERGTAAGESTLEEMDALWNEAKRSIQ